MRVVGVGAGPAALYLAILLKKKDASHSVTLFERHHPGESFGFGVVFSDATMDNLAHADPSTIDRLKESFHHWDDIDVHYRGELLRSTGHGFSGVARSSLLRILRNEALRLGTNGDFAQVLNDFVLCGLPGGGDQPGDPVNSCSGR